MGTLLVIVAISVFMVVPCWKAFMAAMLLEKDPERWDKWMLMENEKRKRRDARLAVAVNGFLWCMGWVERKLRRPSEAELPLDHLESPEHFAAEHPEAACRSEHHSPAPAPPAMLTPPLDPRWEPPPSARPH